MEKKRICKVCKAELNVKEVVKLGNIYCIEEKCPCCTYEITTLFDEEIITTHERNKYGISNSKYLELMKIYNDNKETIKDLF